MKIANIASEKQLKVTLFGLVQAIKLLSKTDRKFKALIAAQDFTASIGVRTTTTGRIYTFNKGKLSSKAGKDRDADVVMTFETASDAMKMKNKKNPIPRS